MTTPPVSMYSNKLRIRAAGLLVLEDKLPLLQLKSPITNELIWTPPGGGVEFGEPIKDALKREFKEESGLDITVGALLHVNELIEESFHAVEFFFEVSNPIGDLKLGSDPEYSKKDQIIRQIGYFDKEQLSKMNTSPAFIHEDFWLGNRRFL